MTYTDTQLKQALAKMLPKRLYWGQLTNCLEWHDNARCAMPFIDTELLHLCWLVEEELIKQQNIAGFNMNAKGYGYWVHYTDTLNELTKSSYKGTIHATWQQRTIALAKVKGLEIV